MKLKSTYLIGLIVCLLYIGCSSGEYEVDKVTVEYNEKQLVYDTIETIAKDTTTRNYNQNQEVSKNESFSFIVQIGAFIEKENFDRFYNAAVANLGSDVYYKFISNLYKIRIGNYNNRADAIKMLDYVKSLGYVDAFIITVITK